MRVHVIGIPHTASCRAYSGCAFTQKVVKMCKMLRAEGHYVIHYGNEGSAVDCDEHVQVLRAHEILPPEMALQYDTNSAAYAKFHAIVTAELFKRKQCNDFLFCAWPTHKVIADQHKDMIVVESGIGYPSGFFAPFKVFESYAMMHLYYGVEAVRVANKFEWYSRVIPNYFDAEDFRFCDSKDSYLLFLGMRHGGTGKGYQVALDVAKETHRELRVAGPEVPIDAPDYVTYVGLLGVEQRREQLAGAAALLAPSLFAEPFCGAQVEAFLSGTPVISTDWGAFAEYNMHDVTGFRCRTLREFVGAVHRLDEISPLRCRRHGEQFLLKDVGPQYTQFMDDIMECYTGKGWYQL